ncbi:Binding-protein-dependent transport systems inner membrane component [Desulfamplus magnetovallimortis]|uniref:Binding-protein-dependent transport systems inner membrane component n=1 Tax=Desulfamplus magnetovallimortis TaxID=1246637 RepID=A0A1W1HKN9_9BACT|nr:putative 2-aminoethylphosphonate ABC transporter permease subunit [Desulfamplus magnetovallimortis]SLM32918.1 Binding-protein-dependent transport systems inner membrane component [Desulfamplus magnetovallimortis]
MSQLAIEAPLERLPLSQTIDKELWIRRLLIGLVCLWMLVVVILPIFQLLSKSLMDNAGNFVGFANYVHYFKTPALSNSIGNSLFVSILTTLIAVGLGFLYAYALTRTTIPGKAFFKGLAMMPLFAPTLLNGISLVYLFGRKGLFTTGFFGTIPGFDIHLYGPVGIIISEVLFAFPQAVLILSIALNMTDARLYEASDSLGASKIKTFFTVTIPGIKYGLISAVFVCFILAFTDFGAPKVVGGNFNILSTDIYKQVIGQQNFVMGAVVSVVLLIPTVIAFIVDRIVQRKQVAIIAAKSVPLIPKPERLKDTLFLTYCAFIALLIVGFYSTSLFASLVKVWPYKLNLGFWHYNFSDMGGGGYAAFFNSIRMAFYSAAFGTVITFSAAYLIEKSRQMRVLREISYFLSILPLALPGLVIGLSYIFFFNAKGWSIAGMFIPNPLGFLYATMGILVMSNIVHFYSVSFLTATTALKQLDKEFEIVSESMGVPFYKTFVCVTVPVCMPAILEIAMYYFVNSMATVSAVIFLYSANLPLASVAVANMDDAGDIAPACAMSILIVLANLLARMLFGLATKGVKNEPRPGW